MHKELGPFILGCSKQTAQYSIVTNILHCTLYTSINKAGNSLCSTAKIKCKNVRF